MFDLPSIKSLDDAKSQLTKALNFARWLVALLFLAMAIKSWRDKDYLRSGVLVGAALWLASAQIGGQEKAPGAAGEGGGGLSPGAAEALAAVAGGVAGGVVIPVGVDASGWWVRLPSGALLDPVSAAKAVADAYPGGGVVVSMDREEFRKMVINTYNHLSGALSVLGIPFAKPYDRSTVNPDDLEAVRGILAGVRPPYPASQIFDIYKYVYSKPPGTDLTGAYQEWIDKG